MRILGLDPGLQRTGWGVIDSDGFHLKGIAAGVIATAAGQETALRLAHIHQELQKIIIQYKPEMAAVEETFVNQNPASALKLGLARGIVLMTPALLGLPVGEYNANHIKKAVAGAGHAGKGQVQFMIKRLLPNLNFTGADAADALAVAICHAHHQSSLAYRKARIVS